MEHVDEICALAADAAASDTSPLRQVFALLAGRGAHRVGGSSAAHKHAGAAAAAVVAAKAAAAAEPTAAAAVAAAAAAAAAAVAADAAAAAAAAAMAAAAAAAAAAAVVALAPPAGKMRYQRLKGVIKKVPKHIQDCFYISCYFMSTTSKL